MKKHTLAFVLLLALASCRYVPFVNYYLPSSKTHFPTFSKWEKFVGSSENPLRASYDITCYDWQVSVNPKKETIKANMAIQFRVAKGEDSIMLDFQRKMKITGIKSTYALKKWKRKGDVLFIIFNKNLIVNDLVKLEIAYEGRPATMLSEGPIFWKQDANKKPWISTITEGIGPHFIMPCKNLLYDEPDSCFIHLGVPKDLVGIANGKLDSISTTANEKIYHWSVKNPMNIYNIAFYVGDYIKIEKPYTDITGTKQAIQIYALSYNKEKAEKAYEKTPRIMGYFEKIYGRFPWWKDGCKYVDSSTPAGGGMEHQSGISIGNVYQLDSSSALYLITHELAHEWWGNSLTGYDYADAWLHEGFAEYSTALMFEHLYGTKGLNGYMGYALGNVHNKRPILKPYGVAYDSWVHGDDQDIYHKGALLLHTIRMQMANDPLFFSILKEAQLRFDRKNIHTSEFITFLTKKPGKTIVLTSICTLKRLTHLY